MKIRKMEENSLDDHLREITVQGEQIRSLQEEKQALMNEFRHEHTRFKQGKISETAFAKSSRKVTEQLVVLDLAVRRELQHFKAASGRTSKLFERQHPEKIRATKRGLKKAPKRRAKRRARRAKKPARIAKRPARKAPARKAPKRRAPKRKVPARKAPPRKAPPRRARARRARPRRRARRQK